MLQLEDAFSTLNTYAVYPLPGSGPNTDPCVFLFERSLFLKMSATLLAETRASNGFPVQEYSLTWCDNVKRETLLLPQLDISPYKKFKDMDNLHTWAFAFMYLEYDNNGRHLQREAVNCIMGMVFYGEGWEAHHSKYTKLDNLEDDLVKKVRQLADPFRDIWKPCIDDWYQEAYLRYPLFKARHDYLPKL